MKSDSTLFRIATIADFRHDWDGSAAWQIRTWVHAGEPFEVGGHRFTVQIRNGRRELQDLKADTFFRAIFQFFTSIGRAATRRRLQAIVDPLDTGPRLVANGSGPIGKVIITGRESPAVTFRGRLLMSTDCKNAALANADFDGAELRGVAFGNADLRNVRMTGLKAIQRCNFEGANLEGARITLDELFLPASWHTEEEQHTLRDLLTSIDTIHAAFEPLLEGLIRQLTVRYSMPLEVLRVACNPRRGFNSPLPIQRVVYDPELALSGAPAGFHHCILPSAPPWDPSCA